MMERPHPRSMVYLYQRPGFVLQVLRDGLVVSERLPERQRTVHMAFDRLLAFDCVQGLLVLLLTDGNTLSYDLGPAAQEVCDLVEDLL